MKQLEKVVKSNRFVVSDYLIHLALENHLSLNEFLVLIFLDNNYSNTFDPKLISKVVGISEEVALSSFNMLMQKKLVGLKTTKDLDGRITEEVDLANIYEEIESNIIDDAKEEEKVSVFQVFESEFGRPLSSMEIEIIKAWLDNGTSEELVIGALKEAKYNGVDSLRYIEKIIYEWNKKKFKTMKDVEAHLRHRQDSGQQELFDYDWLSDYDE